MSDSIGRIWNDHPTATNLWVTGTNTVPKEFMAEPDQELIDAVRVLRERSSRPDDPRGHT